MNNELYHYGVGHKDGGHSGRYPWGSGKNPKQSIGGGTVEKQNKKFKLTDKQKKYIKIGATIAFTALAAYGGYKLYQAYGGELTKILRRGESATHDKINLKNGVITKSIKQQYNELAVNGSVDDYLNFNKKVSKWDKYLDKDWERTLSKSERSTIRGYTDGTFYSRLNRILRHEPGYTTSVFPNDHKYVKELDSALDKYTLKEESTFYRYSDTSILGHVTKYSDIKKLIGKVIHDDGYISTSTSIHSPGLASFKGTDSIRYDIKTPPGKGVGAFVANLSPNTAENEFLFNRGSDFEVTDVRLDQSKRVIVELMYKGMRRTTI